MFYIRLFGIEVEWKAFGRENFFKRKSAFLNQKNRSNLGAFVLHDRSFVSLFTFLARSDVTPTRNCGSRGREEGKRLQPIIHLDVTKISFMSQVIRCRWYNLALSCIATRLSPHFLKLSQSLVRCLQTRQLHFLLGWKKPQISKY